MAEETTYYIEYYDEGAQEWCRVSNHVIAPRTLVANYGYWRIKSYKVRIIKSVHSVMEALMAEWNETLKKEGKIK